MRWKILLAKSRTGFLSLSMRLVASTMISVVRMSRRKMMTDPGMVDR